MSFVGVIFKHSAGNTMKQNIPPAELMQGVEPTQKVCEHRNCMLFVSSVLGNFNPLFLAPAPESSCPCRYFTQHQDLQTWLVFFMQPCVTTDILKRAQQAWEIAFCQHLASVNPFLQVSQVVSQ
jgi:hypothetical protein